MYISVVMKVVWSRASIGNVMIVISGLKIILNFILYALVEQEGMH